MNSEPTAWVEVNTEAILHNYRELKRLVGPDVSVMAVIKTNGFGHGLELVAKTLAEDADWFGVSTVEEGIRARSAAPNSKVLVFHPCGPWNAEALVEHNLTATVDNEEGAAALADAGQRAGIVPKAHLKIDTGMSRFGVRTDDIDGILKLTRISGLDWNGVYTHLATAAGPGNAAMQQLNTFDSVLARLLDAGYQPVLTHALNSAGTLRFPQHRYQLVRCGTLLYGQYPSPSLPRSLTLRCTWALKARVLSLRNIPAGAGVGYGCEWIARRPTRIATIAVGFADGPTMMPLSAWERQVGFRGMLKRMTGRNAILVQTQHGPAPVVGRVAAQSMMLDVTDLPGIAVGDIVEVPSRRIAVGEHIPRIPVP